MLPEFALDKSEALGRILAVMSYSVLVITFIYKAPQVYAVVHSRSSLGLSLPSLLLEFSSYSVEMTYQYAMAYPFETYFEITLMWFQDVILLPVVLENRQLIEPGLIAYLVVYAGCFLCIAGWWLPDAAMNALIMSTIPVLSASKLIQLVHVLMTQDPGSLSAVTWILLSYLALVRVLTTLFVTKDIPMFLNSSSATVLNIAISIAIVYYNSKIRTRRRRQMLR